MTQRISRRWKMQEVENAGHDIDEQNNRA